MISYIKGTIAYKSPTFIIVETAGVGYHLNISLYTYEKISAMEEVLILTHLHIKEDSHTLFGFSEESERSLFLLLIGVSGIGPTTAQVVLSGMSPDEARSAIASENDAAFGKVKGIGPKTAKRIILDLKDKVSKEGLTESFVTDNTAREVALSALVKLGFGKIPVQKALNQILKSQTGNASAEDLIRLGLQMLSK